MYALQVQCYRKRSGNKAKYECENYEQELLTINHRVT